MIKVFLFVNLTDNGSPPSMRAFRVNSTGRLTEIHPVGEWPCANLISCFRGYSFFTIISVNHTIVNVNYANYYNYASYVGVIWVKIAISQQLVSTPTSAEHLMLAAETSRPSSQRYHWPVDV